MEVRILGQGYDVESVDSVGKHLIKLLTDEEFQSFTAISAFATQTAVSGLSPFIEQAKAHLTKITFIVGIDQKVTSKEALEALIEMGVEAYVFHQTSLTIFHPKIYLFEGGSKSVLIIGSSNLTTQGLFTNVEASVRIDLSSNSSIVSDLKAYYKGLFDLTDPNLKKLNKNLIKSLVETKTVPTEHDRTKSERQDNEAETFQNRELLLKIFPKRLIAKVPSIFWGRKKASVINRLREAKRQGARHQTKVLLEVDNLLWESSGLTERDLNIPKGKKTNATGSMLFKKGKRGDIDQRHFFRDEVFNSLIWVKNTASGKEHLEQSKADFQIIIDGTEMGVFTLVLTHNTKTNTKTYQQNNSVTAIRWGSAKPLIAKVEHLGKTIKLYNGTNAGDTFTLVLD